MRITPNLNKTISHDVPKFDIDITKILTNDGANEVSFSGNKNTLCVGLVDIVNSTQITASLKPELLCNYYSVFLNSMSSIVKKYDGIIVKNVGDSILFYFPYSSKKKNNLINCMECCLSMIAIHHKLNLILRRYDLPKMDYRVSADYGEIMVARSSNSPNNDIFGSPVNMCFKINRYAKENEFVIGSDFFEIIKKTKNYELVQASAYKMGFKNGYPTYIVKRKNQKIKDPVNFIDNKFDSELKRVRSATVAIAVERAFHNLGEMEFDTITRLLAKNYHSYLFDCFDKPEYLKILLHQIYGNAYQGIVDLIEEEISKLTNDKEYQYFLDALRSKI